jgi:hypothetical protein
MKGEVIYQYFIFSEVKKLKMTTYNLQIKNMYGNAKKGVDNMFYV